MAKKRKMSKVKIKKAHRLAKELKGKKGIRTPFALATWMVKKGRRRGRRR